MKVAVVGANGYIGKHLCNALQKKGFEIHRFTSGTPSGISLDTGLFPNDLVFPSDLDAVYYLAQSTRYRQTPEQSAHLLSVNCVAAVQAAEAARHAKTKRFIYASTGNVYKPSFTPINESAPVRRDNWYSLSKVMAEEALELYRPYMDITVARIFGVYGPEQTDKLVPLIADKVQSGEDIFVDKNPTDNNDKDGLSLSLIYIDDLVKLLLSLMPINDCKIINLGSSEVVSIRKLATEIATCMGLPHSIKMKDSERQFNLIADINLQTKLLPLPLISFAEGIKQLCRAKGYCLA